MQTNLLQSRQEHNLLFDFYGVLLTPKQREVFSLHSVDDYSFSEIAKEMGITPQAVSGNISRTILQLQKYEASLGMVQKLQEHQKIAKDIDLELTKLEDLGWAEIAEWVTNIRTSLDKLQD